MQAASSRQKSFSFNCLRRRADLQGAVPNMVKLGGMDNMFGMELTWLMKST